MQQANPQPSKLELIDFLKGFSILSIVVYHFLQPIVTHGLAQKGISFGGTGIHLFFLLSGFGLAYSQLGKPLGFVAFIRRKFAKIYLPYVMVVLVTAGISLLMPLFKSHWYALAGHVFLFKMFDESIMSTYGYQFWFISTLFQFYLLFPLLFKLFERLQSKQWMGLVFLLSAAWIALTLQWGEAENRVFNGAFLTYLWEFGLGIWLAQRTKVRKTLPNPSTQLLLLLAGFGLGIYALIGFSGNPNWRATNDLFALTGYTSLAWLLYRFGGTQIRQLFNQLNTWGYPLYLLHMLVLELAKYFAGNQFNLAIAGVTLAATLLVAAQFEQLLRWYYAKMGI